MKTLEEQFVPYQPSLELKELGFEEPCFGYFYHHQKYKILFDNPRQARDYNSIKVDVGSIFDHDKERVKKGLEILGDSVSRMTSVPTFSQAFRWFREKYGLYHSIGLDDSLENDVNCDYQIINHSQSISEYETEFKSYEEAELACLIKLIEIVKNK